MKNISLKQLTMNLTANERAKMINGYIIKQDDEGKDYSQELEDLRSFIPNHQIPEHNFYMSILRTTVYLHCDLHTAYLHMELSGKQLAINDTYLIHATMMDLLIWQARWLPKIVTRKQFGQLYKKAKQEELAAVFSLKSVAKHEAIKRLGQEGFFDKKDDLFSVEEELENNAGKTPDQLLEKHFQLIISGVKKYRHLKQRESPLTTIYKKYQSFAKLTDDQIKAELKKKYDHNPPDSKEVAKWQEAIAQEKDKLQHLIQKGILVEGVVGQGIGWYGTIKDRGLKGITAQSWFDFDGKQDKGLNDFLADKDDVVEFHHGPLAIEISSRPDKDKPQREEDRKNLIKTIKKFQTVKKTKDNLLKMKPYIRDNLLIAISGIEDMYAKALGHVDAVGRIEACYFDNQPIISRKNWFGATVVKGAKRIAENHNHNLDAVIDHFNRFNSDETEITFPEGEKIRLDLPEKADKKESDEVVKTVIDRAIESSNYTPSVMP